MSNPKNAPLSIRVSRDLVGHVIDILVSAADGTKITLNLDNATAEMLGNELVAAAVANKQRIATRAVDGTKAPTLNMHLTPGKPPGDDKPN